MTSNNIKRRNTMSFADFLKVKVGLEKGEHEIVKDAMDGEKTGEKAIATLDEGLESHIMQVIDDKKPSLVSKIRFDDGMIVDNESDAKEIIAILAKSKEFGPATYNKKDSKIEFGTFVKENYKMDIDGGDITEEYAKAIIAAAMEGHKKDGKIDMSKAFEKVAGDIPKFEDRRGMVHNSLEDILEEMTKQVAKLGKKEKKEITPANNGADAAKIDMIKNNHF